MLTQTEPPGKAAAVSAPPAPVGGSNASPAGFRAVFLQAAETVVIPVAAIVVAMLLFGLFVLVFQGVNPLDVYHLIWLGGFGNWFSWQNTLVRAAPILLTALTTALPAQMGLVIIGAEGALALGGLAAVSVGLALAGAPPVVALAGMAIAGAVTGGMVIGAAGALRYYRGVNETISSLLLSYIAIALFNHLVEGPFRDPASLNKPSTYSLADDHKISMIADSTIHWGLVYGVVFALVAYVLMYKTTYGFSIRMVGGNIRAARLSGLPVGRLILITCFIGGAASGLAGMIEIAAIEGNANASLLAGYGYTGILIAFLARQNPLGVIPAAILLGGLASSGGLLQRRLDLPDATIVVLQGMIFLSILASETLTGRGVLGLISRSKTKAAP